MLIGPNHTQPGPMSLSPSHPKSQPEPWSECNPMALGMWMPSKVTWPSCDDCAITCHPGHIVGRPPSQWTWDLRVPTLFLFHLFSYYCMLTLLWLLHSCISSCRQLPQLQIPSGLHPDSICVSATLWSQSQCYKSVHCTTQPEVRVQRGSDSGFSSCTVPTYYCRSEYLYSQCPQVWKLIVIRTEHSLNREECRVKNKARVIPNRRELDYSSQWCWK